MSSSDVLISSCEDKSSERISDSTVSKLLKEDESDIILESCINDEKPSLPQHEAKQRIVYTMDELLEMKVLEASTQKPSALSEEFFIDNVWYPDAWFQSDSSRSSSPFVDGKTAPEGKKNELLFNVELAPKYRDSFKEGCKVKTVAQVSEKQAQDKSRRLTGRAATSRRSFETNYKDSDSISANSHEFERLRKQNRDRSSFENARERNDSFNEKQTNNKYGKFRNEKAFQEETPEWMSEPVGQADSFNFFNSRIEEEKKEYAAKSKKKRVRISPDVVKQMDEKNGKHQPTVKDERSPEGKKFDINAFMKGVEYFPPKMFAEENEDVRSKFTKFFQNEEIRSNSRRNSKSPTGAIIPDEVIKGPSTSPGVPQAFFAPIQPAPALVNAAANAHAIQTSNISNIIEKRRQECLLENIHQSKKEVRGSLSVEELESSKPLPFQQTQPLTQNVNNEKHQDAFNFLLQSMKNAGQLPEKPSPVVSGLPSHLLPHPPTRTSPIFEKLKRTLSRSPSPKDFAKAVSTMASIISSHPSIDKELAILKQSRKESEGDDATRKLNEIEKTSHTPTHGCSSTSSPALAIKKSSLNAFTPTSVLKKMHHERKEDADPNDSIISNQIDPQLNDTHCDNVKTQNEKMNLDSQFMDAATLYPVKPEAMSKFMPFHSAPASPKNYLQSAVTNNVSVSAPGTPNRRGEKEPPLIKRLTDQQPGLHDMKNEQLDSVFEKLKRSEKDKVLMAPSAFKTVGNATSKNDVGVIGSGMRQTGNRDGFIVDQFAQMNVAMDNHKRESPRHMLVDPKLAPGNISHNQPQEFRNMLPQSTMQMHKSQQSQQQQLLQAQRMAQIQQAQLLQQQKLQEIAKLGKRGNHSAAAHHGPVEPLLSEAEKRQTHNHSPHGAIYQQQQHQQLLAYQQQQRILQQHNQQQHHQRPPFPPNAFPNHPRFPGQPPMPPRMPGFQQFPHQPQVNPVNLAAQALVQQQLYNQAARARLMAQATLFQQQPQVMQAAMMAQAALVRGQAQAQAAMMLNPRNINAMAEQMGLRQPYNPNKQNRRHGSNTSTPTAPSPDDSGSKDGDDNILSKWFSNDVLQQSKGKPESSGVQNGKILSVEELEKRMK